MTGAGSRDLNFGRCADIELSLTKVTRNILLSQLVGRILEHFLGWGNLDKLA